MTCNLHDAIKAARSSWNSNYTIADERWRLKQLHDLHRLIIDNRDELIESVSTSSSSQIEEKEIARLVSDISHHIHTTTKQSPPGGTDKPVEVHNRPVGVSLIIGSVQNPFRWMIGPLAASIAAGNVTILATPATDENSTVSLLLKQWKNYLDPDCNFLVPGFQISDLKHEVVDQVVIYDHSPDPYHSILTSPLSRFFNILEGGFNIAIISEETKSWTGIADEAHSMSCHSVALLDRLHAVFVRVDDAHAFEQSLKEANKSAPEDAKLGSEHTIVLESLLNEGVDANLEYRLKDAKDKGDLLIILVKSLDRAIDTMAGFSSPIMQLAILGSKAAELHRFAARWIPARIVTEGFIFPTALIGQTNGDFGTSFTASFVSSSTFSKPVVRISKNIWQLPNDIPAIRATYESLIPPLKPEPRGERIGFFTQVDYLVKGVGVSLGVAIVAGIYYGVRRFR